MRLVVEIRSGPSAGRKIALEPGQSLSVGRTSRAGLVFADDKHMSGLHFVLLCDEQGGMLRDQNSSNGTFLNGARVGTAPLHDGDTLTAGSTIFLLRFMDDRAALEALSPAAVAEVSAETPQAKLLAMLREQFQPLYALLDAAHEPDVLKVLVESKEEYLSLYQGPQGAQLTHFAPYLVRLPKQSPLLEIVVEKGWGKSWGVYLTCGAALPVLREHLRRFLMVTLPDGKQVYFRFYDPRVLRVFLPTCTADEINQFFGPIQRFLMEDEKPDKLLQFTNAGRGAEKKEVDLSPQRQDDKQPPVMDTRTIAWPGPPTPGESR